MKHKRRTVAWLSSALLVGVMGALTLPLGGCGSLQERSKSEQTSEALLGINILAVRQSAGGYILDVRYKVVDPAKAGTMLDRNIQPFLHDQVTGAKLFVPVTAKLGALRKTGGPPIAGHTYFILFANPGKHVAPGAKVDLVVGDVTLKDLVVQ